MTRERAYLLFLFAGVAVEVLLLLTNHRERMAKDPSAQKTKTTTMRFSSLLQPFESLLHELHEGDWNDFTRFKAMEGNPSTFSMSDFEFSSLQALDGELHNEERLSTIHAIDLSENANASICQVFCRFPADSSKPYHFPHFMQQAYPCWSLLQRFRTSGKHLYMVLSEEPNSRSSYIQSFLNAIKNSSSDVSILHGNVILPVHREGCSINAVSIVATKAFSDSGWDRPVKYFMNQTSDLHQLQMAVLGTDFRSGPSSLFPHIHILILDRHGTTRAWVFALDAKRVLELHHGINVTYIATFNDMTLREQAYAVHSADIIISPHGAQLCNLVYIRPCTVVVELFPFEYYLQFFQSLVVAAHGVSFEGYPSGTDKFEDTRQAVSNGNVNVARKNLIYTSPSAILHALPELLNASEQCRNELAVI